MAEKIVMTNSGEATAAIFGAFDMNVIHFHLRKSLL